MAPKELAANQVKAKKTFHIVRAEFAKQTASSQALEDRSKEVELVEDPYRASSAPQLEPRSTLDVVASSSSQALVTVPDEGLAADSSGLIPPDLWAHENSLAKAYSSFTINDRPAAFGYQLAFLSDSGSKSNVTQFCDNCSGEAAKTTPLFSGRVLDGSNLGTFNQYGLLCKAVATREGKHLPESTTPKLPHVFRYDPRIFLNVNAPWSTFICGSQGSGKSYTLSCILENCLIPSGLGQLPSPLAAIVFHYDTFTSYGSRQLCEAAYLCSSGVPVKVLVSPTNFWRMKQTYENLPLKSPSSRKPEVIPMKFQDKHLDVTRMMNMMAVSDKDGPIPLYIEVCITHPREAHSNNRQVILRILREMAVESQGCPGLNYDAFRERVDKEAFTGQQIAPLKLRLELLESFMDRRSKTEQGQQAPIFPDTKAGGKERTKWFAQNVRERSVEEQYADKAWNFEPGTLTIVDLSCPFVDESSACALFSICLDLFLESRNTGSRIVALDEAHKVKTAFLTSFIRRAIRFD